MTDLEAVAADCERVDVTVGDRAPGVVTVTLSRPDARNALDARLREELVRVLDAVDADGGRDADPDDTDADAGDERLPARVVVLTGDDAGGAFAAGADVRELRERSLLEQREASRRPRIYERVESLRQPVVARINGHALGGGLELALACDVRIAHERAKLGHPEINLGLIPGGGGTQRLPRLIGEGQAMRLVLSGELVDAAEAADIGLVEEVHGDDGLDERVDELAGRMAAKSPVALATAKRAVKAAADTTLDDGLDYESALFVQLFATEDKDEGIDAFLEDREPEWRGR
jgi:enoyl-CoA hydratase